MSSIENKKHNILCITSTFPRSKNDHETPGFVFELDKRLANDYNLIVLAPHTKGATKVEIIDNIKIFRFQYFHSKWENIAYNGGILSNLKSSKINYLILPFFIASLFLHTIKIILKYDIKLIHAHWLIPQGGIAILARHFFIRKIPVICTLHGGDAFAVKGKYINIIKKHILKHTDTIAVVSSHIKNSVIYLGANKNKIYTTPMGVDLENTFIPNSKTERNHNSLLFVGRLVEKKGLKYLLEALSIIRKCNNNIHLDIIGAGPEEQNMKNLCNGLDIVKNVTFHGAIENNALPSFYQRCGIFVFPSVIASDNDEEGFGLTLVEALGCGCPVVTTNLNAMKDIITPDITALVVEQKDHAQLAAAILSLMGDKELKERIANAGRNHVRRIYDWNIISEKYKTLYINTIDQHE